jgi:putative FmdB family regulatory protein
MPIYEYQCTSCHDTFELIQKVTDEAVSQCEHCGKNTAVRLVSAPGFQLKGTGWYVTDFRDKSKPNESSSKKTTTSDTKKTESVSTETSASTSSTTKIGDSD